MRVNTTWRWLTKNRPDHIKTGQKRRPATGIRRFVSGAVAILVALAVLGTGLFSDRTKLDSVKAANPPIKTIKFIKWEKQYEMPEEGFWGILMTDWSNEYYITRGDDWGNVEDHGKGWRLSNISFDPYISNEDTFYTRDLMNAPYFHYGGKDGGNKNARRYILEISNGPGKLVGAYLDYTGMQIQRNTSWSNADWMTIMDKKRANEKGIGSKVSNGDNIVFWNTSGNDTALKRGTDKNGYVAAHGVSSGGDDDWTATRWKVYRAKEVEYSCLYTWTMDKNQVWTVENDVILMDGATLTIPEGSVLCVKKGNFYVNGTIKCYGTIIVEDGGCMMPYMPQKKGGDFDIDGGSMVIMSGGRVYAGNPKGALKATENATFLMRNEANLVNYGILAASHVDIQNNCLVENHSGGNLLFGVALTAPGKFSGGKYAPGDNTGNIGLGLNTGSVGTGSSAVFMSYPGSGFWYPTTVTNNVKWKTYTYDSSGNVTVK